MEFLLLKSHSILRYVILVLLLWSLFTAWSGWRGRRLYKPLHGKLHNITRLLLLLQMLLGLTLYYLLGFYKSFGHLREASDQVGFFAVAHVSMMLIAIICINAGYTIAMKASTDKWKFRRVAIFYTIGSFIIFMAIPWPFMHGWATWI
jgi:hypothetical protein